MVKFISVLGIVILFVSLAALLWPRLSPRPRPEPLERFHSLLLQTQIGKNAANVLGVSDDQSVVPLTPQSVSDQVVNSVRGKATDIIITNAVKEITKRFKDLPLDQQEKVIDAFTKAVSESQQEASPSENLPDTSQ